LMLSLELVFNLVVLPAAVLLVSDAVLRTFLLVLRVVRPAPAVGGEPEAVTETAGGCVIIIAAHDEAETIGATVVALKGHLGEWPSSSLWVVADRCTDATAAEAESAGAQVAERASGRLGKGAVIAWWLHRFEAVWRSREAVVILDADSRLAAGSLGAMRDAVAREDKDTAAFQAFVTPDANNSSGRLSGWSEVLMQRIDDEARRRCGWSVPLRGTGMAFRGRIFADLAPRLHTLAEDLELDVLLASERKRVAFVPGAVVFDPKPQQSAGASRQRARWLRGQLQVLVDYRREIAWSLIKGGLSAWFLLLPLFLRPKVLFIGLRLLLLLISVLIPSIFWIALAGLTMDAVYYLAGAAMVDNPRRYLFDLLAAPRYAAMWFYSFGIAVVRRGERTWLRAGR
jgi:cellulose synthase/poly-beta-1,6-N-acetylglucosamine synthase-like glycosyltransferase